MAETLTVTVDDGGTYTIDVRGVALFTDTGLTTPATFPTAISAQTTWYAAAPAKHGPRANIEVLVTASDGSRVLVPTFTSLPATVSASEGSVDFSGPATAASGVLAWAQVGHNWNGTADYARIIVSCPTDLPLTIANSGGLWSPQVSQPAEIFAASSAITSLGVINLGDIPLTVIDGYLWVGKADGTNWLQAEVGDPVVIAAGEAATPLASLFVEASHGSDLTLGVDGYISTAAGGSYGAVGQVRFKQTP